MGTKNCNCTDVSLVKDIMDVSILSTGCFFFFNDIRYQEVPLFAIERFHSKSNARKDSYCKNHRPF